MTLRAARVALIFAAAGCAAHGSVSSPKSISAFECKPDLPCWPTPEDWRRFGASLAGKLEVPRSPLEACHDDATSALCATARNQLKNPFYIQDQSAGTQSAGWLGAWTAAPSAYAVVAKNADDVARTVTFARDHGLRLVIKGTGHDYLGRSNAPDSLLVWTHEMRQISMHDAFIGAGCADATPGAPAVSVGAGTRWLEAYDEVTVKHERYVQGGGCTSVGAAGGFMQGGGFGSWSKKYGTGASNMLEAEVVTADGKIRVANACQNQDLFWALRGGGGGTFGIVTRVTLRTHPLPNYFGQLRGTITAKGDAAFRELLEQFALFYGRRLNNESWGEQITVRGNDTLEVAMVFQGMSGKEAEQVWRPFHAWIDAHPERFTWHVDTLEIPGNQMWSRAFLEKNYPTAITGDEGPGRSGNRYWWTSNQGEVSAYWYAFQSRWIPAGLFDEAHAPSFAATLFEASRHWPVELHFNKGQAGASAEAIQRDRETSMNPAVYRAAGLAIVAAHGDGTSGRAPDPVEGEAQKARVGAAMKILRDATPGAGSYVNEADYFEPDWQQTFWGENYPKLLEIKRKYDPAGLFSCHHCVGSE